MKFTYLTFQTERAKYLYDGISSRIFNITDCIYEHHRELFEHLKNEGDASSLPEELREAYQELTEAYQNGYLLPNDYQSMDYWFDEKEACDGIDTSLSNLIIELTQRCNMRCKYCVYSGHYDNTRIHGTERMDIHRLKRAVDYFISHSRNTENPVINLYGGEPFYEYDIMKEIVEYISQQSPGIDICITTNGLLLNKQVIEWFSRHENVSLLVSLAGVPTDHDKLRVTAGNAPTFQAIRENLMYAREYDLQAYVSRINFIFNIFDEVQLQGIQDFWDSDELFQGLEYLPEVSFIDMDDRDGYVKKLYDEILSAYQEESDPLATYIRYLKQKDYNKIPVRFYDKRFLMLHTRSLDNQTAICGGACKPMLNRVFTDCKGNFGICENLRFSGELGNIEDGINTDNVTKILADYKKLCNDKCLGCWVVNICQSCFKDAYNEQNEDMDRKQLEHNCANEKGLKKEYLIEYCRVLEEGEDLLNHLYDYVTAE